MSSDACINVREGITRLYYFQRLLPFITVYVLYELVEMAVVAFGGWDVDVSTARWLNLFLEMGVSMLFAILPYLLYLIALPAAFHGGRCDRAVTVCVFSVFCLFNGVEELSEVLSDYSFHLKTTTILRNPGAELATFFGLESAIPSVAVLVAVVGATVWFFRRHLMADADVRVPGALSRALYTCWLMAIAFVLNYSLLCISPAEAEPEVYHDGIFSLFGSLMSFTAVPHLGQVFAPSCLWLVVAVAGLCLVNAAISRYFSPVWAPLALANRAYSGLSARYGRFSVNLGAMLVAILCIRLMSLGIYPLMDTTEARYGEMARKMLETGVWLQPQYEYGVPFWGKPPLSFWGSAATMWLFGINEWAARLAPFLVTAGTGLLFYAWPFADKRKRSATACFIVMMTTGIGFIAAGAVMTDAYLMLGCAISMVAFWRAMQPGASRRWGYWFFIGLAVGLMGKGPLVLVLCGAPIFLWICLNRKWGEACRRIPWVTGGIVMLLLTVPWYLAAEQASPGFLRYFLVGEHFERFVVKGWQGDLYGAGHARPFGIIWLYGLEMFLPWVLLLPFLIFRKKADWVGGDRVQTGYLLLWLLSPLAFFTFARNILPAYVLPGLPAFCILVVNYIRGFAIRRPECRNFIFSPAPVMLLMVMFGLGSGFSYMEYRCHKDLISAWDGQSPLYYYDEKVAYSGQFYSAGKAVLAPCPPERCPVGTYAVVDEKIVKGKVSFRRGWKLVNSTKKWSLYVKESE